MKARTIVIAVFQVFLAAFAYVSDAQAQPLIVGTTSGETMCAVLLQDDTWKIDVLCGAYVSPKASHESRIFEPPYFFQPIWYEVIECLDSLDIEQEDIEYREISFYAITPSDGHRSFKCDAKGVSFCAAIYLGAPKVILMANSWLGDEQTIRHEFMHARGVKSQDHGTLLFSFCAGESWPLKVTVPNF